MSHFSEAQLEKAFVDLFKEQEYVYVHGDSISHDVSGRYVWQLDGLSLN